MLYIIFFFQINAFLGNLSKGKLDLIIEKIQLNLDKCKQNGFYVEFDLKNRKLINDPLNFKLNFEIFYIFEKYIKKMKPYFK